MTFGNFYELNLIIGDKEVEMSMQDISLAMTDSLYSLYNKCSLKLLDATAGFQEFLFNLEGMMVQVEYGIEDKKIGATFVNRRSEPDEVQSKTTLGGTVNFDLIHQWYNKQVVKSKAYADNTISSIVNSIMSPESSLFSSDGGIDISDTTGEDTWYQCMITDARFIHDQLMPNAWSGNANNTPFYAFITNDNVFNFKHLHGFLSNDTAYTYYYSKANVGESQQQIILDIKQWNEGSQTNKLNRNRLVTYIDPENGDLIEEEDSLKDYPETETVPILNVADGKTSYLPFLYKTSTQTNNLKGQKAHTMRHSIFLDRFMLLVPFNPYLKSGMNIDLYIEKPQIEEETGISDRFSGTYLIEICTHVWDGQNKRGYSRLIIGRKELDVPRNYAFKELAF
jgi:hypothetical protein